MKDPLHQNMRTSMVHMMMFSEYLAGTGPILETLTELAMDPFFEVLELGPINDPKVLSSCMSMLNQAQENNLFVGQACTH